MTLAVEAAQAALDRARSAYLNELEQDSKRADGSGAQEARRDAHQKLLNEEIAARETELNQALREERAQVLDAFDSLGSEVVQTMALRMRLEQDGIDVTRATNAVRRAVDFGALSVSDTGSIRRNG